MPDGAPMPPAADPEKVRKVEEAFRLRDVQQLIRSAGVWMQEAMNAWSDDDYAKVAVLAPLAVEHLGKAVLWHKNPVLVVPLTPESEASLVKLATSPSLADPKLRTVGLKMLLTRVEAVTGSLPISLSRRTRMVEIRNGAMHIASTETSRHVLIDSLTVCNAFLAELKTDPEVFYGDHKENVKDLVEQGRSEVEHRVTALRARARKDLKLLRDRLGDELFEDMVLQLQVSAEDLDLGEPAIAWPCPECANDGRLAGPISLTNHFFGPDPDDPADTGFTEWFATMSPSVFLCPVCRLKLTGLQEIQAAGLPQNPDFDLYELDPDFDPDRPGENFNGTVD